MLRRLGGDSEVYEIPSERNVNAEKELNQRENDISQWLERREKTAAQKINGLRSISAHMLAGHCAQLWLEATNQPDFFLPASFS